MDHDQPVALVTGANKGIGLQITRRLAASGIFVIMGARSDEKGEVVTQELQVESLPVLYHDLDVTKVEQIKRVVRFIDKKFGRLDILVNNAGILIDGERSTLDLGLKKLTRTLETNLFGPIMLCQCCVPLMKRNHYGRIVNFSSILGSLNEMANPKSPYHDVGAPAYRISKTALNAVTTLLARELDDAPILVNSFCPGWGIAEPGALDADPSQRDGVETAVWLATLPEGGPTGGFFHDKKPLSW